MGEDEIRAAMSQIISFMQQNGLNWILQQVAMDADEDREQIDSETVRQRLVDSDDIRATFLQLLNALELVFVETARMESEIYDFFNPPNQEMQEVFVDRQTAGARIAINPPDEADDVIDLSDRSNRLFREDNELIRVINVWRESIQNG